MYQDVPIGDYIEVVNQKLARGGVFLTAKDESRVNTMTIGWGGITRFWNKPIMIVPVRLSRYTHQLIEKAKEFTVSVPLEKNLLKQLSYCGTHSGRDENKYEATGLTPIAGKVIATPIIAQCELHFECRVVYQQTMDPEQLDLEVKERWYPDYHTMYFGEIVACYRIDSK
jgi:flavin reductase (DIM6/NTAB) family NADH-FMN oxidoreductase RutF